MSDHTPDPDQPMPALAPATANDRGASSVFTILACLAAFLCWFTPRILLLLPVMAAIGCAATSWSKRETGRKVGLIAGGVALCILLLSSFELAAPGSFNLGAAKIERVNWRPDPEFGGRGTIKWNVEVRNLSDRPIARARVNFVTRDAAGNMLASTLTFVDAIPPGGTRSMDDYADYYGSEATASATLAEVRFSD